MVHLERKAEEKELDDWTAARRSAAVTAAAV